MLTSALTVKKQKKKQKTLTSHVLELRPSMRGHIQSKAIIIIITLLSWFMFFEFKRYTITRDISLYERFESDLQV